jgi:hypothetical protein
LALTVEQAMARHPERRFVSADSFAQALRSSVPYQDTRLPGIPVTTAVPDDDATRGTRTFGPRPPRRETKEVVRRFRLPATFFVLIVLAGALYLIRGPLRPEEPCPEVQEPVAEPEAQIVAGDPEGDGCETFGVYQLHTLNDGRQVMLLTIRVHDESLRIQLGARGDQVFLGDWNCDEADTPGIYRRAAGQVEYFDIWPEIPDELLQPQRTEPAPPGATASFRSGGGDESQDDTGNRCDRIEVGT